MDFRLYFRSRQGEMVHLLKQLVMLESPTGDKKAVDLCAAAIVQEFRREGARVTVHPQKEIGDLQVVPLAGGFDLELFFVFGDRGTAAAADGRTPSRASISGAVALVGAGCGHMGTVTFR